MVVALATDGAAHGARGRGSADGARGAGDRRGALAGRIPVGRLAAVAWRGEAGAVVFGEGGARMTPPYRDPNLPPKPKPVPITETWHCTCGKTVLNHYDFCYWCFNARPPRKEPT